MVFLLVCFLAIASTVQLVSGYATSTGWLGIVPFILLLRQKNHLVEHRVTTMAIPDPQLFFRLKSAHFVEKLKFESAHVNILTILHSEVMNIDQFHQ